MDGFTAGLQKTLPVAHLAPGKQVKKSLTPDSLADYGTQVTQGRQTGHTRPLPNVQLYCYHSPHP